MDTTEFNQCLRDIFVSYASDEIGFTTTKETVDQLCDERLSPYVIDGPPNSVLTECFNAQCELFRRAYEIGDILEYEFKDCVTTAAHTYFYDPELRHKYEEQALALITAEAA